MNVNLTGLQQFIAAREAIRKGVKSNDPIFMNSNFCNIRREDDKVSQWIFENCTSIEELLLARLVNRIDNLQVLRDNNWDISVLIDTDRPITNSKAYQFYPKAGENIRSLLTDIESKKSMLSNHMQILAPMSTIKELSLEMSAVSELPMHFYFMMVILDAGHMGLLDIDMATEPYMGPGGKRVLKELNTTLEDLSLELDRPMYETEHLTCEYRKYIERSENGIPNNRKRSASLI